MVYPRLEPRASSLRTSVASPEYVSETGSRSGVPGRVRRGIYRVVYLSQYPREAYIQGGIPLLLPS